MKVSGKCSVEKDDIVRIGDAVTWSYVPDEGTLDEGKYKWDLSPDAGRKPSVLVGSVEETGFPEITVSFDAEGLVIGPLLTFAGKEFDCGDFVKPFTVYPAGYEPTSSSVKESSSSEAESSSSEAKSSSSAVRGYCMVSKREAFVDEEVFWYIVDENGVELEGYHNWTGLGAFGTLVSGEREGNGSTRIKVKYSTPGQKEPAVQYGLQVLTCDVDDDLDPWLRINPKIEESSSSYVELSSSDQASSSSGRPPVID